jgi:LuxR family maltose regulon positive regulatory protein
VTWSESPDVAIRAADAVLGTLEEVDPGEIPDLLGLMSPTNVWAIAVGSRGRALWYAGNTAAGREQLQTVSRRRGVDDLWRTHAFGALALLEAWAGNLETASRHARRALLMATRRSMLDHPGVTDAYLALAQVARQRGEVRIAGELLDRVERSPTVWPTARAVCVAERADWFLAVGLPERGIDAIDRFRSCGDPAPPPAVDALLRSAEIRLRLAVGALDRARAVLGSRPPVPGLDAVRVQVAVAVGDAAAASDALETWQPRSDSPKEIAERELWNAIVAAAAGDRRSSLRHASVAVAVAEAQGRVAILGSVGKRAERIAHALLRSAPTPFLHRAIKAVQPVTRDGSVTLSGREREIVRFLPTPLSSAEIAAHLYVSINTLKTHLRTIYRKLAVTSRDEAIERVEQLGLA